MNELFIKNGRSTSNYGFPLGNPGLRYICVNENEISRWQQSASQFGYVNCQINSYCSFVPGGVHYIVSGNNRFDSNNDGCDASDVLLKNLKFNLTDGVNSGVFISNATGQYSIPFTSGTHTITPVLENPSYFTISPPSVNVTFPTQASPYTQNFCVTINNPIADLEVVLLPLNAARPGFNASYKLIYKNKGNTTQSGSVNLTYNDAVLDFVSAYPVESNQANNSLSWDFTNLLPFETREITVALNVNSPTETPAVNDGDILHYTTAVTSAATDEMPNDNTFVFHQRVVNSYDPNDKTCIQGTTIAQSQVGKYVHYMIRFENTGTFPAQNIVVKDMIDTNKFDINSLVPLKGSHPFVTNITSGNKVEFIFENINLPFDDANNDGYVAFKIKTKPSLVVGNTFSNSASIYFDYNFPIVTNTATTTIQTLSTQDFGFGQYFSLYPNPVKDVLNIETKQTIEVSSINIYNQLGQLVLVVPNAHAISKVDVSALSSGNYFIKINSDKGTSNTKFIKQ
ncbi:T9SS type A sorting domain-containing protein [Flavobacterium enshiense]|nr:T9SS type A sorting domain-containing protein [Flavobacterium enshiense]